jgi:hypothetical protein
MWFLGLDGRLPVQENSTSNRMRVLTLTPFYPTASDDAAGCFVAEPLRQLADLGVSSCVVAVQPLHRGRAQASGSAPAATWIRYPSIPSGIGLASSGAFLHASLITSVAAHRSDPRSCCTAVRARCRPVEPGTENSLRRNRPRSGHIL